MRGTVVFLYISSSRFCTLYKKKVMKEELYRFAGANWESFFHF
jgi:hypothetical protein